MQIDEIVDLRSIIPNDWKALSQSVRITGYQTATAFEAFSGGTVSIPDGLVLFYSGMLTFDQTITEPGVELVEGEMRFSAAETSFGKTKASRWIVTLRPDSEQCAMSDSEIEGLLRTVMGFRLLLARTFVRSVNLEAGTHGTWHSLVNPYLLGPKEFTQNSFAAIVGASKAVAALDVGDKSLLIRSLGWMNEAFVASDKWDSFLKIWIALEMLFIRGKDAVSSLKYVVRHAYGVVDSNEEVPFAIGRIYGLRKRIVHNGEMPSFNSLLIDFLGEFYRDLFSWKLSKTCPGLALRFLEDTHQTVEGMISGGAIESGST